MKNRKLILSVVAIFASNLFASHFVSYDVGELKYRYDRDAPESGAFVIGPADGFGFPSVLTIPASAHLPLGEVCEACDGVHFDDYLGKFVDIPVVGVGDEAFRATGVGHNREIVQKIIAQGRLVKIGENAFRDNISLQRVIVSDGVGEVCSSAFYGCKSLESFEVSGKWPLAIGDLAFHGCSSLKSFEFQKGLSFIGERAFFGTSGLKTVELPEGIVRIGDEAFGWSGVVHVGFPADMTPDVGAVEIFAGCKDLIEVDFPTELKHIPELAFEFCDALVEIDIPAGVKSIGAGAFKWTALESVLLPEGLKKIESETFKSCEALEWVNWPSALEEVGELAFFCTAITNADFRNTELAVVGDRAFESCGALTNGVFFPQTLRMLGEQALFDIGVNLPAWYVENLPHDKANSYPGLTVEFLGGPPEAGDDLVDYESKSMIRDIHVNNIGAYQYLKFPYEFKDAWMREIESYKAEHIEETWEWHNLRVTELIAEPVKWENDKPSEGDQTMTIGWHLPTNENVTIEAALADLPTRHLHYAVWRSGDDPEKYDDFASAVCITQNVTMTNYVDESFGAIEGTHPVCYWVEIQRKILTGDPQERQPQTVIGNVARCVTRRRFGLAVGLSEYASPYLFPGYVPTPLKACVNDVNAFVNQFKQYKDAEISVITNSGATVADIRREITSLPYDAGGRVRVVPGDIVMLFMASHGNDYKFDAAKFCFVAYDNVYEDNLFASDLSWADKFPAVRVVGIFPFCNSGGFVSKCTYENFGCAYGADWGEESSVYVRNGQTRSRSQYGYHLVENGWKKGCAGKLAIQGLGRCPWVGELNGETAPGDDGKWIDFLELGKYAKIYATGGSSGRIAHGGWREERILSSVIAGKANLAAGSAPAAIPFCVAPYKDGSIAIYYGYDRDEDDLVLWYSKDATTWNWVRLSVLRGGNENVGAISGHVKRLLFGCHSKDEKDSIGDILSHQLYYFKLQGMNQYGFGKVSDIQFTKTGDVGHTFYTWLDGSIPESGLRYVGTMPISDTENADVDVSVEMSDESGAYNITLRVTAGGLEHKYEGESLGLEGEAIVANCKKTESELSRNLATGDASLPNRITVAVRANGIRCVTDADAIFECVPIDDTVKLDEVVEENRATILRDSLREEVSQEAFDVYVDVESSDENVFTLSADIVEPNGGVVGSVSERLNCIQGINTFTLSMSRDWLVSRKRNGPYSLMNVKLCHESDVLDSEDELYITQMSDFALHFGFDASTSWSSYADGVLWNYRLVNHTATLVWELGSYGIIFHLCAINPEPKGEFLLPCRLGGWPVTCIGESAFDGCSGLTQLTIPASVADIHKNAFSGCNGLTNVIFKGNAPKVDDQVFAEMAGCQVSVCEGTVGWDDDGDGLWNGMRLSYYEPEVDEWEGLDKQVQYLVRFNANGGSGAMPVKACVRDAVYCLPTNSFSAPTGKRFAGWACSNGRRYDDGMLVFNLAQPGETVTMTAIWE